MSSPLKKARVPINVRIISGIYKGRRIQAVGGKTTRPTTDRVREAWASTLENLVPEGSFEGMRILDAFAGSGALGLELLSRGADTCLFLENDKKSFAVLRENILALGVSQMVAQLCFIDSLSPKLPACFTKRDFFNIVILDPPYSLALERLQEFLTALAREELLAEQSLISYEHGNRDEKRLSGFILNVPRNPLTIELVKTKKYGTINLDYYLCKKVDRED